MLNILVEKTQDSVINISPMSIKRDWMDVTEEKHAYRCFPVTQANMVGWNLFCDNDIEFIWNGITSTSSENIEIINGKNFTYTGRGQSTVSFNTGLTFKTDENISLLTINPVNYFNDDFETVSSVISTSWMDNDFPLAIRARSANKNIVIKAGTPLATIIPVSLTQIDNTSIEIFDYTDPDNKRQEANKSYGDSAQKMNQSGQWTDWYRDAVNEKGESLGKHETKVLRLSVIDKRQNREMV
jgi:transposase